MDSSEQKRPAGSCVKAAVAGIAAVVVASAALFWFLGSARASAAAWPAITALIP